MGRIENGALLMLGKWSRGGGGATTLGTFAGDAARHWIPLPKCTPNLLHSKVELLECILPFEIG